MAVRFLIACHRVSFYTTKRHLMQRRNNQPPLACSAKDCPVRSVKGTWLYWIWCFIYWPNCITTEIGECFPVLSGAHFMNGYCDVVKMLHMMYFGYALQTQAQYICSEIPLLAIDPITWHSAWGCRFIFCNAYLANVFVFEQYINHNARYGAVVHCF